MPGLLRWIPAAGAASLGGEQSAITVVDVEPVSQSASVPAHGELAFDVTVSGLHVGLAMGLSVLASEGPLLEDRYVAISPSKGPATMSHDHYPRPGVPENDNAALYQGVACGQTPY